jgi:hypothetical protein
VTIEIVSDAICPWCFVGSRRLSAALARSVASQTARVDGMARTAILFAALALAPSIATPSASLTRARGARAASPSAPSSAAACAENICGGGADVPVDGTVFYAEMTTPGLPANASAIAEGTYFIYTNIYFFDKPKPPSGSYGVMNQFVPQLMLGNPLSGSSNWPYFLPSWSQEATWVFASQYFMELFNATSGQVEAKAAAGEKFNVVAGETLWTSFARAGAPGFGWSLSMGVKGDASRTSVVLAPQPYMGLIPAFTASWDEPVYAKACVRAPPARPPRRRPLAPSPHALPPVRPAAGS